MLNQWDSKPPRFPTEYQTPLTQELNGLVASTQSEINHNVDHAGLSVPPKHFQTDSALMEKMLFLPQKTWLLATQLIKDAMEDISQWPGDTCKTLELLLTLASHTPLDLDQSHTASTENVKALKTTLNINAPLDPLLKPLPQIKLNLKSMPTDPWRLHSLSTLTS